MSSNTVIQLKKSGTTGNTPESLNYGELALNWADGKLYYKNGVGIKAIYNQKTFSTINANNTLILAGSYTDTLKIDSANGIQLTTDAINKTIVIDGTEILTYAQSAYAYANTLALSGGGFTGFIVGSNTLPVSTNNFVNFVSGDGVNVVGDSGNPLKITFSTTYSLSDIYNKANGAFDTVNSVNTLAHSSYDYANSIGIFSQSAYNQANTADVLAQGAFDKANVSNVIAQASYDSSNSTLTYATAAFNLANTANVTAQAAFDSSNSTLTYAASGYGKANSAFDKANASYNLAQASYNSSNTKFSSSGGTIDGSVTITGQANVYQRLSVGQGAYTILPNLIAQFTGTSDLYSQVNQQNLSGNGTGDFVVTSNDGTDLVNYIDMGIAGNTYNNAAYNAFPMVDPNDGYFLLIGNPGQNFGGNVFYGTTTSGSDGNVVGDIVFIQGTNYEEVGRWAIGQGLVIETNTASTSNSSGALVVYVGMGRTMSAVNVEETHNLVGIPVREGDVVKVVVCG